ncbi:hypothetical protein E4656_08985 [Natronospirillum operosum]|uniref:Uncharacterized protein n=1 Tax=Natronospirillum operosum TaxID=2759953 RepID=A0A4Z0WDH4_9GAMM|nr:hypothetical protein E4656_08985 [Natronospirillum operosum]
MLQPFPPPPPSFSPPPSPSPSPSPSPLPLPPPPPPPPPGGDQSPQSTLSQLPWLRGRIWPMPSSVLGSESLVSWHADSKMARHRVESARRAIRRGLKLTVGLSLIQQHPA